MPKIYPPEYELIDKLCEAMGIPNEGVQRIVVDVSISNVGQPIKIYVQIAGSREIINFDWSAFLRGEHPRRVPSPGPSELKMAQHLQAKRDKQDFDTPQTPDGGKLKGSPDELPPGYEELL